MAITKTLPAIPYKGMPGFLLWARRDSPALYSALVDRFPVVGLFESKLRDEAHPGGVGDFSDILSSIGDTIASSASDIGSWVADNAGTILKAGASVAVAVKGAQVAQTQLALAQMNKTPARTAYNAQGQLVAVKPLATGVYSPPTASGGILSGSVFGVPTWMLLAGAGAVGLIFLLRRR